MDRDDMDNLGFADVRDGAASGTAPAQGAPPEPKGRML